MKGLMKSRREVGVDETNMKKYEEVGGVGRRGGRVGRRVGGEVKGRE